MWRLGTWFEGTCARIQHRNYSSTYWTRWASPCDHSRSCLPLLFSIIRLVSFKIEAFPVADFGLIILIVCACLACVPSRCKRDRATAFALWCASAGGVASSRRRQMDAGRVLGVEFDSLLERLRRGDPLPMMPSLAVVRALVFLRLLACDVWKSSVTFCGIIHFWTF